MRKMTPKDEQSLFRRTSDLFFYLRTPWRPFDDQIFWDFCTESCNHVTGALIGSLVIVFLTLKVKREHEVLSKPKQQSEQREVDGEAPGINVAAGRLRRAYRSITTVGE